MYVTCKQHYHTIQVDGSEHFDDFAMARLMKDIAWETMSTVVGQENNVRQILETLPRSPDLELRPRV